jgi:energy-converting hydrogenase Eha subunit F
MKGLSVILTVLLLVVASQLPHYLKKAQIAPKDLPANRESSQSAQPVQTRPLFATFTKDPQQKIN